MKMSVFFVGFKLLLRFIFFIICNARNLRAAVCIVIYGFAATNVMHLTPGGVNCLSHKAIKRVNSVGDVLSLNNFILFVRVVF